MMDSLLLGFNMTPKTDSMDVLHFWNKFSKVVTLKCSTYQDVSSCFLK